MEEEDWCSMKPEKIVGGLVCKKCGKTMQRFQHKPAWKPKSLQPYYFAYWDKCSCGMIQLYEKAKIYIDWDKEPDELTDLFKATVGPA